MHGFVFGLLLLLMPSILTVTWMLWRAKSDMFWRARSDQLVTDNDNDAT